MVNVGYGTDITIRKPAETIADVLGFDGRIVFDESKPDGTPRKLLDSSRLFSFGWRPRIQLREGIRLSHNDFFKNQRFGRPVHPHDSSLGLGTSDVI